MILEEDKVIITFHTTTEAMAMEAMCKKKHVEGRIIPVPAQISAGCGLAWSISPDKEEAVIEAMKKNNLVWEGIHRCRI